MVSITRKLSRVEKESEIHEPIVFPWMPAASVYFDDPDGHSLEYIAILPEKPLPNIPGITTFSEWKRLHNDKV